MRKALVSLMCHPERVPRVTLPEGGGYESFVNTTPNYADAYRSAMARAVGGGMDLVTADSDGYHPAGEIAKLATATLYDSVPALVLPYRENIGVQSKAYSLLYSLIRRRRIRDSTGGLCRLSYELMVALPRLRSRDMTIHIEILDHAIRSGALVVQYGYLSGPNDESESRRTSHYQWKLLKAAAR